MQKRTLRNNVILVEAPIFNDVALKLTCRLLRRTENLLAPGHAEPYAPKPPAVSDFAKPTLHRRVVL